MKKTIFLIIVITMIILFLWPSQSIANTNTLEDNNYSNEIVIEFIQTSDKEELLNLIQIYQNEKQVYLNLIKCY